MQLFTSLFFELFPMAISIEISQIIRLFFGVLVFSVLFKQEE